MVFRQKWVKIFIVPLFLAKIDDITVMLSLNVLPRMFFHELALVLSYSIPSFVKIKCYIHDQ